MIPSQGSVGRLEIVFARLVRELVSRLGCQEVPGSPANVLWDVLLELPLRFSSQPETIPRAGVCSRNGIPPSPFREGPDKTTEVPNLSGDGTFLMLSGPGSSQEKPQGLEKVLLDVLLEIGVVLLDKIGVVGFLRCLSLTRKSRQRKQVPGEGISPSVTRYCW